MATGRQEEPAGWTKTTATGVLVLADGTVLFGQGVGAVGAAEGEVCFNTAMTGYQEILTDPSYKGQIVTFTFPHIGNVGATPEDLETGSAAGDDAARGLVIRTDISAPSNWRSAQTLQAWLEARGIVGLAGIDTRALAARIRDEGMVNAVIAHAPEGSFDIGALKARAAAIPSMAGLDLASSAATRETFVPEGAGWSWPEGFATPAETPFRVVALDYGCKRNIMRCLADVGCEVTVVGPDESADAILAREPDGIFLANGPGDPAATGERELPKLRRLVDSGIPLFGICLGHQMLGLALGGRTTKMRQGHHGANHPGKDHTTGKVEIVSMNHGFAVDAKSLPEGVEETHTSLFDGSNSGLRVVGKPVFSVQHHPEASPGPRDSHYLFRRFRNLMAERKGLPAIPEDDRKPVPA